MINIYEETYNALARLGCDVREQGTYGKDTNLPETFATYQIIDSPSNSYADGKPTSITYRVQVAIYSKKPAMVQSAEPSLKTTMEASGFMRVGGRALPFDAQTGHYGYTCDYRLYDSEV